MGAALFISYSPGGGLLFYEEKWEKEFLSQIGGRLRRGAKPVRLAAGALLLYVRVVAGCAPCRVTPLTLGVTLQRSAAPPFPGGPCVPPGAPYQNTLGAVPQDPLTAKLRLDTNDAWHRPYSAADTLSRCLRRIYLGLLQTNSRKSRCQDYKLNKQ